MNTNPSPSTLPVPSSQTYPEWLNESIAWGQTHWLFLLITLVLSLLLFFFVVMPLIRRFRRRKQKEKETSALKKDLMVWRNLSRLVQGGEDAKKAKSELSGKLHQISQLFQGGLSLIRSNRRKLYDVPWYVLLGEPMSGKSAVLQNSELELIPSCAEEPRNEASEQGLPLRFWLGAKSVVLDIGGRVFFDRWVDGSSAEWSHIIKLIAKRHAKKPLDGIIITLPVDALLADNETLSRQKAMLISSELSRLLYGIGMQLPCYLIVTKLDMLCGCREYFANLDAEMRSQFFGWTNPDSAGRYSEEEISSFRTQIVQRLRDGRDRLMLLNADESHRGEERLGVNGGIYLFPEYFERIFPNLSVYLRVIFGCDDFHGTDGAWLRGINFTSAEDTGVSLNFTLAQSTRQELDTAVLQLPPQSGMPLFVRGCLTRIFHAHSFASFSGAEVFRRNILYYLLGVFLLGIGTFWIATALVRDDNFLRSLQANEQYYNFIQQMAGQKNIESSPLLVFNEVSNQYEVAIPEMMSGQLDISRLDFFYDLYCRLYSPLAAPLGFRLSSLVATGYYRDISFADKAQVFDNIQSFMVYLPVMKALEKKFSEECYQSEPFNFRKRAAFQKFISVGYDEELNLGQELINWFLPDDTRAGIRAYVLYLIPHLNDRTVSLLDSYLPTHDRTRDVVASQFIFSQKFFDAQLAAILDQVNRWTRLDIYPDSLYVQLRDYSEAQTALAAKYAELLAAQKKITDASSAVELNQAIAEWKSIIIQVSEHAERVTNLRTQIDSSAIDIGQTTTLGKGGTQTLSLFGDSHYSNLLTPAAEQFHGMLEEDFSFLVHEFPKPDKDGTQVKPWDQVDLAMLENTRKKAVQNLMEQQKVIRHTLQNMQSNVLFQKIPDRKPDASITPDAKVPSTPVYQIVSSFHNLIAPLLQAVPDSELSEFRNNWLISEQEIQTVNAGFDSLAKKYAEEKAISEMLERSRSLLRSLIEARRYNLFVSMLKKYPKSQSEFREIINRLGNDSDPDNLLQISDKMSVEILGITVPQGNLSNAAGTESFARIIIDIRKISPVNKDGASGATPDTGQNVQMVSQTFTLPFLGKDIRFEQANRLTNEYFLEYIRYWGTYPDTIRYQVKDWPGARTLFREMKPYAINVLLASIYRNSINRLQAIHDNLLSSSGVEEKKQMLLYLNERLKLLSPHFTEICTDTAAGWSQLSEDADIAWNQLNQLDEKQLRASYFPIHSSVESVARIPWWNFLLEDTLNCLQRDSAVRIREQMQRHRSLALRFPLCADSLIPDPLSVAELQQISEYLNTAGFKSITTQTTTDMETKSKAVAMDKPLLQRDAALFTDHETVKWGQSMLLLADALTNDDSPIRWTLTVPDAATQKKLLHDAGKSDNSPGYLQFRYVAAKTAERIGRRFASAPDKTNENNVLLEGDVTDSDLRIDFYRYQGDSEPEATLSYLGKWGILRAYLTGKAIYDPTLKLYYLPLEIRGRNGEKSNFYIGLSMNKVLPSPSEWPSRKNWPDFSEVQSSVRAQRQLNVNWETLLKAAGTGDEAYKQLCQVISDKELSSYPDLLISIADNPDNHSSALYYRIVELKVSGESRGKAETLVSPGTQAHEWSVPLISGELEFLFYCHANDPKPAARVVYSGPCAPFRLLTHPSAKNDSKGGIEIMFALDEDRSIPLRLKLANAKPISSPKK